MSIKKWKMPTIEGLFGVWKSHFCLFIQLFILWKRDIVWESIWWFRQVNIPDFMPPFFILHFSPLLLCSLYILTPHVSLIVLFVSFIFDSVNPQQDLLSLRYLLSMLNLAFLNCLQGKFAIPLMNIVA